MHADFTLQGEVLVTMKWKEQIAPSEIALLMEQHYSGISFKSSLILLTTKLQISQLLLLKPLFKQGNPFSAQRHCYQ